MTKPSDDTLNVRHFIYLRMFGMGEQGDWVVMGRRDAHWGHFQFPVGTIELQCMKDNSEVILQETVNPDSTIELVFNRPDRVGILGNTFIYFGDKLPKKHKKS